MARQSREPRMGSRSRWATNLEIQKWVARTHGFVPESDWIIHCKQLFGIDTTIGLAPEQRFVPANPCPPERQIAIKQAFQHFGMLPIDRP
jgi:hypothetical protein